MLLCTPHVPIFPLRACRTLTLCRKDNGNFSCNAPNSAYCDGSSPQSNIIIHCDDGAVGFPCKSRTPFTFALSLFSPITVVTPPLYLLVRLYSSFSSLRLCSFMFNPITSHCISLPNDQTTIIAPLNPTAQFNIYLSNFHLADCNDYLAGIPAFNVKARALCWESAPKAGDAVCRLDSIASNDNNNDGYVYLSNSNGADGAPTISGAAVGPSAYGSVGAVATSAAGATSGTPVAASPMPPPLPLVYPRGVPPKPGYPHQNPANKPPSGSSSGPSNQQPQSPQEHGPHDPLGPLKDIASELLVRPTTTKLTTVPLSTTEPSAHGASAPAKRPSKTTAKSRPARNLDSGAAERLNL